MYNRDYVSGPMSKTINTRKFRRTVRDNLLNVLSRVSDGESPQVLVVQQKLVRYLNGLCTFSQLKESSAVLHIITDDANCAKNIEEVLSVSEYQLVFLVDVRSDIRLPEGLTRVIKNFKDRKAHLVYVSWETEPSNKQGKLPHHLSLQLDSAVPISPWFVLPTCTLDDNLLSCEVLYNADGDSLYAPAVKTLQKATREVLIQNLSNAVQVVLKEAGLAVTHAASFGNTSHKLVDHVRSSLEGQKDENDRFVEDTLYGARHSGLQCNLVVVERDMDLLTPLCSQLTYAGILDDLYELRGTSLVNPPTLTDVEVKTLDYTKDEVWNELKFKNFGALGPRLNELARELQTEYDARHQAESVGEIKQFVENLGSLQERQKILKLHTTLSSKVVSEVSELEDGEEESLFNRVVELEQDLVTGNASQRASCDRILELLYEGQLPRSALVRLCCILSLTCNGVREREYNLIRTEMCDAWGVNAVFRLQRLARAGMFVSKQNAAEHSPWHDFNSFAAYLDLVPQQEGESDPGRPLDASFAYCGSVPVVTRMVQLLYDRSIVTKTFSSQQPFIISRTPSWRGLEELFGQQYGRDKVREQKWDASGAARTKIIGKSEGADPVLVVFVGGATVGEVATLQFLSGQLRRKGVHKRFIVLADGIAGGARIELGG